MTIIAKKMYITCECRMYFCELECFCTVRVMGFKNKKSKSKPANIKHGIFQKETKSIQKENASKVKVYNQANETKIHSFWAIFFSNFGHFRAYTSPLDPIFGPSGFVKDEYYKVKVFSEKKAEYRKLLAY